MRDFRDLVAWQKAHRLAVEIYRGTASFPREERFGLTSQVRRSAASIGANIAEGHGRGGGPEFRRFLAIALGSATELQHHLLLARDLGYLDPPQHGGLESAVEEVRRLIRGLAGYPR